MTGTDDRTHFAGQLEVRTVPGPPNYASVADGDGMERAFILVLDEPACAFDGSFIDESTRVDRVHLFSLDAAINSELEAAVGHEVEVIGEGFGEHTGHHHAPVVLDVSEVAVR